MEENVALDTAKQKKFVKSIKGIKKLIKKNEVEKPVLDETVKTKNEKVKRSRPERGLVYLSHIPHGFYENQMSQYFKQFGVVTNARVIRSKRTGNSKGCAFVEFKEPAVAEIVAETMNNYLMGKRLIKAAYVPPEKQRRKAFRKHWSRFNNPGRNARLKMKKSFNENKDEKGDLKRAKKILSNLNKTKKKLSDMGIDYDFFTPVDIPEALQDTDKQSETLEDKAVKKEKKQKKEVQTNLVKVDKNSKENKKAVKAETQTKTVKNVEIKPIKKEKKKEIPPVVVNKKEQKQKQQKLKDAGVKPPETFIKVEEDHESESGDDSSVEFDSDEYEKMMEDDSDVDSNDSEEDGDDDDSADEESEEVDDSEDEEIVPPKKSKGPIVVKPQPNKGKQKGRAPEQVKRKEPQKTPVISKKPKFEKQAQQPMKKQFKKKK